MGEERARRLELAIRALVESMRGLRPTELRRSPTGEEWTALQVMGHVAEFVPFWAHRARGVAASDQDGIDFSRTPAEWELRRSAVEEGARIEPGTMIARLEAASAAAADLLRGIPDARWSRTGTHWSAGLMTVAELVDKLILEHAEEHVEQACRAAS